jgi:hypothetical protein
MLAQSCTASSKNSEFNGRQTMSEYDFLNTLKEDLPPDFAQELKAKLDTLDSQKSEVQPTHRTFWTVAAASLVTVLLGIVLVINRIPQLLTLVIAPYPPVPSFTEHGLITTETIDQLQPFARLGNGMMTGIHMMPDGEHLLITATTGLYLFDAHDLKTEPEQIYEGSISYYSDIDANGNLYGLAESTYGQRDDTIIVARWNSITGERNDILRLDNMTLAAIEGVQVNPEGSQILLSVCLEFTPMDYGSVCTQRAYTWYDAITGEQLDTIPLPSDNSWLTHAINDDWTYIAYEVDAAESETLSQPMIQLMNVATREIRTVITFGAPLSTEWGINITVDGIEFSPNGQSLITRSFNGQRTMYVIYDVDSLWETEDPINPGVNTDFVRYRIVGSPSSYYHLFLSPDNETSFAISNNRLMQFDLTTEKPNMQPTLTVNLNSGLQPLASTVFSSDGSTLYIHYYGNIVMAYDAATLNQIDEMAYFQNGYADTFQFTQDGTEVAIYSADGGIANIWTINTDPPTRETFLPDGALTSTGRFVLSPDGNTIAYKIMPLWEEETTLWISHRDSSNEALPLATDGLTMDLSFLRDGTLLGLIMKSDTGELSLMRWSLDALNSANTPVEPNELPLSGVGSMSLMWVSIRSKNFAIDGNGQWFALSPCRLHESSCIRDKFTLWNLQTGEQVTVEDKENFHEYGARAFSPDNLLFAYGYCAEPLASVAYFLNCEAGEVRFYTLDALFSTDTPMPLFTLTEFDELPTNIAFNPIQQSNGSWLVAITVSYTHTQLWRVHPDGTHELLRTLDTVQQPVTFDPTGSLMFTTTDTAQTEVWGVPVTAR